MISQYLYTLANTLTLSHSHSLHTPTPSTPSLPHSLHILTPFIPLHPPHPHRFIAEVREYQLNSKQCLSSVTECSALSCELDTSGSAEEISCCCTGYLCNSYSQLSFTDITRVSDYGVCVRACMRVCVHVCTHVRERVCEKSVCVGIMTPSLPHSSPDPV